MAKLTYNNGGITFNNVTSTNTSGGTFIGKPKIFNGDDKDIDQETLSEYGLVPIVQALQIDWNAANLGKEVEVNLDGVTSEGNSAVINTTGRMLSCLSTFA